MDRGHVRKRAVGLLAAAAAAAVAGVLPAAASTGAGGSFIGGLNTVKTVASTIPANGDVNPYGVAIVPKSHGDLTAGDVLVSNFNNAPQGCNQQGRGTTIVEISPGGHQKLFATIPSASVPGGVGLTTALVALRSGWVIVGSLPTADGTSATMQPGELFVLDARGHVREVIKRLRDRRPVGRDRAGPRLVGRPVRVQRAERHHQRPARHHHQGQRRPAEPEPDRRGAHGRPPAR